MGSALEGESLSHSGEAELLLPCSDVSPSEHLSALPPAFLPGEMFQARLIRRRRQGKPGTLERLCLSVTLPLGRVEYPWLGRELWAFLCRLLLNVFLL